MSATFAQSTEHAFATMGAQASDPRTALTAGGLTGHWRSDMGNLPVDPELLTTLSRHAKWCQLGSRTCRDCQSFEDSRALSAIAIANTEHAILMPWIRMHPDTCVYCGDFSAHMDHLVPKPWTGPIARRYVPLVPACADCNTRINDAPAFRIHERSAIVAKSLQRRWSKELAMRDIGDDDLTGMAERFRNQIARRRRHVRFIRCRLIVLDAGGAFNVDDEMLVSAA